MFLFVQPVKPVGVAHYILNSIYLTKIADYLLVWLAWVLSNDLSKLGLVETNHITY